MSNVEKFEELLRSDETLQAKVKAAIEAYKGDASDDRAFFDAVITPLAAKEGLPFTYDEGKAFAEDGVELSDNELDAVAGGGCWGLGLGEGTDACMGEDFGATGCYGVGVGVFTSTD